VKNVDIKQRKCDFCEETRECFGVSNHQLCCECRDKIRPLVSAVGSAVFLTVPEEACDFAFKIKNRIVDFYVRSKEVGIYLGYEYLPPEVSFPIFSVAVVGGESFEDAVKQCVVAFAGRRKSRVIYYASSTAVTPASVLEMAEREGEFWRIFVQCFVYQGLLKMEIEP